MASLDNLVRRFVSDFEKFSLAIEEGRKQLSASSGLQHNVTSNEVHGVQQRCRDKMEEDEEIVEHIQAKLSEVSIEVSKRLLRETAVDQERFEQQILALERQLNVRQPADEGNVVPEPVDNIHTATHDENEDISMPSVLAVAPQPLLSFTRSPTSMSAADIGLSKFTLEHLTRKDNVLAEKKESEKPFVRSTPSRFRTPSRTPIRALSMNEVCNEGQLMETPACQEDIAGTQKVIKVDPISPYEYETALPSLRAIVPLDTLNNTISKLNYRVQSYAHLGPDAAIMLSEEEFRAMHVGAHEKQQRLMLIHFNRLRVAAMPEGTKYCVQAGVGAAE